MPVDHIRYDILAQEALRRVVRTVLEDAHRAAETAAARRQAERPAARALPPPPAVPDPANPESANPESANPEPAMPAEEDVLKPESGAEVVRLDRFRKKPSGSG